MAKIRLREYLASLVWIKDSRFGIEDATDSVKEFGARKSTVKRNFSGPGFATARAGLAHLDFGLG